MQNRRAGEAKARFDEPARGAVMDGPRATRRRAAEGGLSAAGRSRSGGRKPSFVEFLRASPLVGIDLDIERDKSPPRDVEL